MYGGYTRYAIVFLIIFVLFILIAPGYGYGTHNVSSAIGSFAALQAAY